MEHVNGRSREEKVVNDGDEELRCTQRKRKVGVNSADNYQLLKII